MATTPQTATLAEALTKAVLEKLKPEQAKRAETALGAFFKQVAEHVVSNPETAIEAGGLRGTEGARFADVLAPHVKRFIYENKADEGLETALKGLQTQVVPAVANMVDRENLVESAQKFVRMDSKGRFSGEAIRRMGEALDKMPKVAAAPAAAAAAAASVASGAAAAGTGATAEAAAAASSAASSASAAASSAAASTASTAAASATAEAATQAAAKTAEPLTSNFKMPEGTVTVEQAINHVNENAPLKAPPVPSRFATHVERLTQQYNNFVASDPMRGHVIGLAMQVTGVTLGWMGASKLFDAVRNEEKLTTRERVGKAVEGAVTLGAGVGTVFLGNHTSNVASSRITMGGNDGQVR